MTRHVQQRQLFKQLNTILSDNPDLHPLYQDTKKIVRAFRRPAFYEITQRCNLWCEGCYYFDQDSVQASEIEDIDEWENFFAAEKERGVSMAYFVGAEPAVQQDRLLKAAKCFPYGNVGTNGTIALHPDIPFRIGVSIWAGNDATDKALRGGSVFRKALKNYEGDRRAVMLYTVTRQNIDEARLVAQMCKDFGLDLTFNLYSPTHRFQQKLEDFNGNDKQFFRISSPGDTPCFSDDDLAKTRDTMDELIEDFPDTVIYSHAYNRWSTTPGPRYRIDPETGVAENCGSRIVSPMSYYTTELTQTNVKCCTPSIDCSQCRMYSGGWSSLFQPNEEHLTDAESFKEWMGMIDVLGRIFLLNNPAYREAK